MVDRVLAIAVASRRAGYVLLQDGQLRDWGIVSNATKSRREFMRFVQELIDDLRPEAVVTEKTGTGCRKGKRNQALIDCIAALASRNSVYDISVERPYEFPTKYEEAAELVERYPDLIGYLPKQRRRIFDSEPRGMVLFEALLLASNAKSPK